MDLLKKWLVRVIIHLEVWFSILFQLLVGMSVLQKNKIHFNEFSLENNVYIRDVYSNTDILGYWKYVVDGINYYILIMDIY